MRPDAPIGVFDSGVGGLTVVRQLMSALPDENIVYFGDTARVPYGTKSRETVRAYAADDTAFLLSHHPKLIVIACSTVSSVALDVVEELATGTPVIGTLKPSARLAAEHSISKRIGVIGTSATVASNAYQLEINAIDESAHVFSKACPLFVPLAEEGFAYHEATRLIAREYLSELASEQIDTLVLGCTHYPILKKIIGEVMNEIAGEPVRIIDAAEAVASDVAAVLREKRLLNDSGQTGVRQFFVSDVPQKFRAVAELFLGMELGGVSQVRL
ncbi:MAG: glutamate racemase [Rhizobacter sp.]|nr:glutamate racemase [Chlorobiales bacterium]